MGDNLKVVKFPDAKDRPAERAGKSNGAEVTNMTEWKRKYFRINNEVGALEEDVIFARKKIMEILKKLDCNTVVEEAWIGRAPFCLYVEAHLRGVESLESDIIRIKIESDL
ncbi:MAG: hypothetical protein A3B91_02280 [Candidatus Yanofskybacteria bacterium RIFCSPHIGHO2_02_FULL_41_29]|uniref:Uncharacterized protein n=1 Tax=Candidatus Yanofskybacteria bacterium RIFCSPHIGHO2_01_FULL_41_53 TaxID=1802663 RepID=A0A1F8EKN5_9BACT|nr:MAG: hypothetical protein A2650_01705 [Candidatus Yanofskybacteria bacterium RIFCSPHIGHO2_01_FULL_41_53]OGN12352.1 MAG: hypothetical protein A3B91_02280 [Candidatus Yanofskybacteria bacterium RIFCSPHIGHO2_02_FULL_41_29]OGN17211.1 MAG: hypothetical protein A3F48_00230 [Candidatus Yanofskybacteria bacterium RIFCSPHIGHO2_12_FULL_41_9]OGN23218.1 MAG: hypothetical protein A2916_02695 [Candidatus Yanofskybacteria bacterium RIFCSPLOWO2_01_FULL_41_67]OGN28885.1 MAG: hypothetical protein A3H54_01945 